MQLKNISQKIIHVGSVMILPDETKPVDDSLSSAPAVAALIARGALSVAAASSDPAEVKSATGEPDNKKPAARTGKGEKSSHE